LKHVDALHAEVTADVGDSRLVRCPAGAFPSYNGGRLDHGNCDHERISNRAVLSGIDQAREYGQNCGSLNLNLRVEGKEESGALFGSLVERVVFLRELFEDFIGSDGPPVGREIVESIPKRR
jgi:hypothetical protein